MFKVCCPSCGWKKPKLVELDQGRAAVKCPECGLNTGQRKTTKRAIIAWNHMEQRMLPVCRLEEK